MEEHESNHNAVGIDLPNGNHVGYVNKIHYGNQNVPKPNNSAAMRVDSAKIMRHVREAK